MNTLSRVTGTNLFSENSFAFITKRLKSDGIGFELYVFSPQENANKPY